ncbi:sensor histidine kinase, partial [Pseudoxanthomonas sp. SGD-10]
MRAGEVSFKKNILLIVIFLVVLLISLTVALSLGHNLIRKYVESEFYSLKIDVLEDVVAPYNEFVTHTVPEISYYQGYLDFKSAKKYADSVLIKYPFVENIMFYDAVIRNKEIQHGITARNLQIGIKNVYQYGRSIPSDSSVVFDSSRKTGLSLKDADEFNNIGLKVAGFIESADTTKTLSNEDIFKTFYNISSNKISYMSVPRREDIGVFQRLMITDADPSPDYEQDLFSFTLNPHKLVIINRHPKLYEFISFKPVSYDPIVENVNLLTTDIPLPGAFSEYKLYFASSRNFLEDEVNRRFMPIAFGVFVIYLILAFITYLIYRNFSISRKLFKLQYDFINNFTHEFKTPVSVIKIAGNNIKSAASLSEAEQKLYGKILDEEADKLNDLMNKLLSFTQIENRSIKIKSQEIDLRSFSESIITAYKLKYPDYEIHLDIQNVKTFYSDPVLLTSVYQN